MEFSGGTGTWTRILTKPKQTTFLSILPLKFHTEKMSLSLYLEKRTLRDMEFQLFFYHNAKG